MRMAIALFILTVAFTAYQFGDGREARADRMKRAFALGERESGPELNKICQGLTGQSYIFCVEGFFRHKAQKALSAAGLSPAQAATQGYEDVRAQGPKLLSLWAVAFGIALGSTPLNVAEAAGLQLARDSLLFSYVVDGWALMHSHRNGPDMTRETCAKSLGPEFKDICDWGIGRGLFFKTVAGERALLKDPAIALGFEFAKNFTREGKTRPARIAGLNCPSAKIAELGKRLYADEWPDDLRLAPLLRCLQERHASSCALQDLNSMR